MLDGLALAPVRVETWGGFVFVNLDRDAEPLLDYLDPLPTLLGPYHLEQMRLRASLSTKTTNAATPTTAASTTRDRTLALRASMSA